MKDAITALKNISVNKSAEKEAKDQIEQSKAVIAGICLAEELPGLRQGDIGMEVHGYKTRKTFSQSKAKELILLLGGTEEQIEDLYEEGDEYLSTRIVEFQR